MRQRIGRRLISIMLSVLMLVSLLPTAVFAEELQNQDGVVITEKVGEETGNTVKNSNENEDSTGGEETKGESSTTKVKVGGKEYTTLEAAIAAASAGDTVTLLSDVTLTDTLTITKNVTLDLSGKTLTVQTGGDGIVVNNAELTLANSGSSGKYVFDCSASGSDGVYVYNEDANTTSKLIVNSDVEIKVNSNVNSAIHAFGKQGTAVVDISNGKITATGSGKQFHAIHADQNSTINVTGGEFGLNVDFESYSESNDVVGVAIFGSAGKQENIHVNITNGKFTVGGKNAFAQAVQVGMVNGYSKECKVSISGGEIVLNPTDNGTGYVYATYKTSYATAEITGGSVSGTVTALVNPYIKSADIPNDGLTVSGGTFSTEVDAKYLAEGVKQDANGNIVENYVAKIGTVKYDTLDDAIKAVENGGTIVVNAGEYTLNGSLTYTGKAFTIKAADGMDVSFDMSKAVALHGAKITFEGVIFDYKTNGNYIGLQHTDTLVYNKCTINGMVFLYATNETFNSCTFEQTNKDAYNVWTYGAKNVEFNSCTFNCVGKSVLVYNEGTNTKTDLTVKDTKFIASAPVEGKAAIEIDTSLMQDGTTITVTGETTATGFDQGSNSKSTLWNDKKQTADTNKNTTVTVNGKEVFAPKIAEVGGVVYPSLEAAFAALSAKDHTLKLLNESVWDATTPVYWAAGEQSGYVAKLTDALTAAYKANAGDITIVCRPGADVGTMTHGHVADNITIYGNDAYISGGECDLEVDTFKFSRATGKQDTTNGEYLTKDITINAYELDNLGVWGQRNTSHTINVNLTDCDGKAIEGKENVQRVYISNNSGVTSSVNNITLTGCDFLTAKTAVYSNANGAIVVDGCSFTGSKAPVNINHDGDGAVTVEVKNSTFTNCGDKGEWKNFAAPIRFVNSGSGTMKTTVDSCTFEGTVGKNGDILIGDGRAGKVSNDLSLTVKNTYGWVQAQKPGRYDGNKVDSGKRVETEVEKDVGLTTSVKSAFIKDTTGTRNDPYTLEQLSEMTRDEYIAAQKRLKGTMYVTVGNYEYDANGVLGNGVRNDTPGQVPDHSKLNSYAENGYLGEGNDDANGKNIVFVNGSITSNVYGYTSIDNIGTSLLLAVPAYTNVTFEGITFNNVMSFDYQLYTSPWSQLGELKFKNCVFEGIIVGAIAAQELTFDGCRFEDYENSKSENNSNPTWIRPAYGNWTKDDNEGQGTGFRSLTKITFTNNTVTSTRPVKFERIAQWEMATTVTATGNTFTINKVQGDTDTKNVGMYFGANAKFDLVVGNNKASSKTAGLYTAVYNAPNGTNYPGLPAGSTVKDASGNNIEKGVPALVWKSTDKLTLKTTEEVAQLTNTKGVVVKFATLEEAINAAANGETVTLLKDVTEDVTISKGITLDLGGKTLTNTNAGNITVIINKGVTATVKNGSITGGANNYNIQNNGTATFEDVIASGNNAASMIDNFGTLTIKSGTYTGGLDTVKNEPGATLTITGGDFTLTKGGSKGFTGVVFNYGTLTITGGTFTQADKSAPYGQAQVIHTDKSGSSAPSTVITGGTFKNLCTRSTAWVVRAANAAAGATQVSGGTFNKKVSDSYWADDYGVYQTGTGKYEAMTTRVAKIDYKYYETLEEAVNEATAGQTVTLVTDVTIANQLVIDKKLNLDLGKKTLTSTYSIPQTLTSGADRYALVNNAELTIRNGTFKAGQARAIGAYAALKLSSATVTQELRGGHACVAFCADNTAYTIRSSTIKGAYAVCSFANNATIEISKSELIGTGNTLYHNGSNYGLKLTVKDTTITSSSTDSCGVYISGSTDAQSNTANQNGARGYQKATFTNCTISGANGVEVKYTDLTLDNCTVEATVKTPSYTQNNNGPAGVGFAVVSTDNAKNGETPKPEGKITVTGEKGHYTGPVGLGSLESVKTGYPNFADKTIDISAGTFSCAVPEDYCAEGFIPTKNADGTTYGVKAGKYVAEVKGTKYETLQAAINAAGRNATVTMLADTRENVTINNAMTLDLNGYTLNGGTVKGTPTLKIDTARVTVMDSSEAQTGTIMREDTAENSGVSSHYVIDIQGKNALLTFNSGNVRNNSGNAEGKGASLVRVGNDSDKKAHSVLTIAGGTFTQDNFIVIKVDFGTLHLKGGTVNSKTSYAVENWLNANIKGVAVVNGAVSSWTYSSGSNSTLTISGGTVNGDVTSVNYGNAEGKKATVAITGGTINGELDTRSYDPKTNKLTSISDATKATIEVTAGTFAKDPTKYVVEDSTVNKNTDGTFGVEKAYLAKVGETSYYTMDEAFHAAVASGETLYLLRDYTTGAEQNSGSKSFAIDLGGHIWTYTGTNTNCAAFQINYPNVTLTVKNGTVVSNSMVGLIPSAMGGTITYDNAGLVFENVKMTAKGHSGIETNGNNTNDTVTLKNSTLDVPNGFGIYFPSSGTLTIDNSTINAKTMGVQVCAGSLIVSGESTKITVTGDAVPKTENDGAIQDGAAISIVNRTGYKGLGAVTISEGTFVAKSGNQAIKAYDWNGTTESAFTAGGKVTIAEENVLSSSADTGVTPTAGTAWVLVSGDKGLYAIRKVSDCEAEINGAYYLKLQDAIDAAQNGATVVLVNDVDLTKTVVVNKTITLDMGGKKLFNTADLWDNPNKEAANWSLISVRKGGDLTITGNGTFAAKENDCYAVDVQDGAKLVIKDGTFVGNIHAVYVFEGTATIDGGTYSVQQKFSAEKPDEFVLNCYDANRANGTAKIIVNGGTFQNFDPMNNQAEGVGTSFVAAGVGVDHVDGKFTAKSGMTAQVVDADGKSVKAFDKLSDALAAVEAKQTVKLLNDVANETFVMVKAGVTLDLAGKNITGATMLYVTGTIVDTAASDTKGAVSAEAYMIASSVGSGYTPVYNGTGYQFYKLGMNIMKQNASEDSTTVVFAPKAKGEWTAERNAFRNLLASGYNVSKVQIVLEVEWGETNTHDSQRFAFNDQYVHKYATEDGWAFSVTMNGLKALSGTVTATAKIVSYGSDGREMTWLSSDAVTLKGE